MRLLPLPERDLPEPGAARRVPSLPRPRRRDVQPLLRGRPTDQRVFRRRDFEPLQGQTIRSVARDRSPDVPATPARDGDTLEGVPQLFTKEKLVAMRNAGI